MINQEQHRPTQFCHLRACAQHVYTCPSSVCVCVYVLTFPSLQFRGFLGSVPLKAIFFSAVSSGTYYSLRHFHKRAFQLPLRGSEWDTLSPAERELIWAS